MMNIIVNLIQGFLIGYLFRRNRETSFDRLRTPAIAASVALGHMLPIMFILNAGNGPNMDNSYFVAASGIYWFLPPFVGAWYALRLSGDRLNSIKKNRISYILLALWVLFHVVSIVLISFYGT